MKKFSLKLLETHDVEQINTPEGRFYKTPSGVLYPSVTTVLSKMSDKTGLEEWAKRVGEKKASEILRQAGQRGTEVHSLCEKYLLNDDTKTKQMPIFVEGFNKIKPILDKYVETVYGIELPVYSDNLKTAGKTDLFCQFGKHLAVVDFKTSRSVKREEYILNYFLQSTAYSICIEEMYSVEIPLFVVIIACDTVRQAQVFVKKTATYRQMTIDTFKNFHNIS